MSEPTERRFNFTQASIRDLPEPEAGAVDWYDDGTNGLVCRVTAKGRKSFRFYRWSKLHGRPVTKRLGETDEMSVEDARRAVRKLSAGLDEGTDPNAEFRKRQAATQTTLADLWQTYASERHPHCRPSTIRNDVSMWERHILGRAKRATMKATELEPLPVGISNTPAAKFTGKDAAALHVRLTTDSGATIADEVIGLLSRLYRFAGIEPNPCRKDSKGRQGIRMNGKAKIVRYLTADTFQKLVAAIDADSDQEVADLVRLALFTGQRRDNVRTARWDEIDLHLRVWRIPAAKFKTNKGADTPLPKPAVDVLKRRKAIRDTGHLSPYVFPSRIDTTRPRTMIDRQVRRIFKRAGLADWRFHDLRHACASAIVLAGGTLAQAGRQLNHANAASTERYAHLDAASVAAVAGDAFAALGRKTGKRTK